MAKKKNAGKTDTPPPEESAPIVNDVQGTETIVVADTTIEVTPTTPTDEEKQDAVDGEWVVEKLAPYLDSYPDEREFHIASDGQVFLKANKADAIAHQKFLNDGKQLTSFTVEQ